MSIQRVLIPGLVFQGVVIGGGYSTGRELVEFFLSFGAWGALLGMTVATLIWSVTLAIAFNYAVLTRSFDYASFLDGLLGPLRYVAEAIFVIMALLVIAVISDATETIFQARFGTPPYLSVALLAGAVCAGLTVSKVWLERLMAFWSILLYIAFIALFALVFSSYSGAIGQTLAQEHAETGWAFGALQYAGYNLAVIPAVLFTLTGLESVKEARLSGALAGVMGMIPAFLFAFAMFAFMPDVLSAPVPLALVLSQLDTGSLGVLFDIVILGTLLQTILGTLNALGDRVAIGFEKREVRLSGMARGGIGLVMIVLSIGVGVQFGIINIIAKGYGALTIGFLLLLVAPILTVGLWRCVQGPYDKAGA